MKRSRTGFPIIHRMKMPNIANVQCHRLKFEPGDRIIVRLNRKASQDEKNKLHDLIQKWADQDVNILIVDLAHFDIEVEDGISGRWKG